MSHKYIQSQHDVNCRKFIRYCFPFNQTSTFLFAFKIHEAKSSFDWNVITHLLRLNLRLEICLYGENLIPYSNVINVIKSSKPVFNFLISKKTRNPVQLCESVLLFKKRSDKKCMKKRERIRKEKNHVEINNCYLIISWIRLQKLRRKSSFASCRQGE